jgi:hypothetical protein
MTANTSLLLPQPIVKTKPDSSADPILTIVTPTRGNFTEYWLSQLLQIQGDVEFILVYPPGVSPHSTKDIRIKSLTSPYKGEMMQRFIGLLNASGRYTLALDDDDFVHPHIVRLVDEYFAQYPESWILRLKKAVIDFRESAQIIKEWDSIPDIAQLNICRKTPDNPYPYQKGSFTGLLEVPIAPLTASFDLRRLVLPWLERQDNQGYHFENFNNIVWQTDLVQQTLPKLAHTTKLGGVLTWIPRSGFDRLLGLFVQANHFQEDAIIGHWIPGAEQIRYIDKPPQMKPTRFHVLSDVLLVKAFPQYGYFWNLFFSKLYEVPHAFARLLKNKFSQQS